jgi:transposase
LYSAVSTKRRNSAHSQAVLGECTRGDRNWYSFEDELGGSLLQVYDITLERVRLDSTTASSYCGVNPEGLFQWGHSKDHRPDLAQVMK